MNHNLQKITDFLQQSEYLSVEERASLAKAVKDAESEMAISAFKLDRTEKVKRTTAILLEETIEELEKKREAVEAQNRELEIEFSLERVRTVAMGIRKPGDLLSICEILYTELHNMGFGELRNAMINIHNDEKGSFLNYDFSESAGLTVTTILYNSHPATENLVKQVRSATDAFAEFVIRGDELDQWREYRKSMGEQDDPRLQNIGQLTYYFFSIGTGAIGISTYEPISEEKRNVLKRFRNVFELAYRRYLDVTLAEAQAQEARIELALERVRARTMAMQKSDELGETAFLLFQQFQNLGETPDQITIGIIREEAKLIEFWITINGNQIDRNVVASIEEPNLMNKLFVAWKANEKSIVITLSGKQLNDFIAYRREISRHIETPSPSQYSENRRSVHSAFFSKGFITFSSTDPKPAETIRLLERFAGVFDQTYTRFLDLQKAEAQIREAQIEAALEKVRSRSLAMHHSEELWEVVAVVFEKFQELKFSIDGAAFIATFIEGIRGFNCWLASEQDQSYRTILKLPQYDTPTLNDVWLAKESGADFFSKTYSFEEKNHWLSYAFEHTDLKMIADEFKIWMLEQPFLTQSLALGKNSLIGIHFHHQRTLAEAEVDILKRFSKVFDQAYIRFLDLQKAEAQAREGQIQLSMERVRASAMAMQKSDELTQASNLLFQQMQALEIPAWSAGYCIWDDDDKQSATFWMSSEGILQPPFSVPLTDNSMFIHYREAYLRGEEYYAEEFGGEELVKHYQYMGTIPDIINMLDMAIKAGIQIPVFPEFQVNHVVYFSKGFLLFVTLQPVPEVQDIFRRFGKVFDQTYIRFLDLQKAEGQAREAQIEVSLERLRSRMLRMQKSSELEETTAVMYQQLHALGVVPEGSIVYIVIIDTNTHTATQWIVSDRTLIRPPEGKFRTPMNEYPTLIKTYEGWKRKDPLLIRDMSGKELKDFKNYLSELSSFQGVKSEFDQWPDRLVWSETTFSNGTLGIIYQTTLPEATLAILVRFSKVFDLTYTRFNDLKQAEAQAREAIKRASVDRVRAEIASMRTTSDLERITPLIWNELTTLGVPFIRCGVFIMDEEQQKIETHLSTSDGKAIASFTSDFSSTQLMTDALNYWRRKEIYKTHWDENAFLEQAKSLVEQGAVTTSDKYLTAKHPTDLYLHFLPFLQGMLYVGNEALLNEDELHLVQNLADAFSTAYARYEDFNKLESAKAQIEKTLVDLKQTQAQLVQAEKMASLGELTAGIAHEIQNPLNFVNNFSEVNAELIEEMKEEIEKGNLDEVKLLANDIADNEQKINHHGKRADAIVKGMLQHSRSSSGVKEPTDINALADEYLRLAYHGLRAKDKSFNADFKTDFDPNLPKINIIPQDIGRVLLNLINNAFYACAELQRDAIVETHSRASLRTPTVKVTTATDKDYIRVTVSDNGPGIPAHILDKIFQPFFTTKPTGQGTGLGLSMSYDIVKAHGGELKVETLEGVFTEFTIELGLNNSL